MKLEAKKIIGLLVETQSGQHVGKVHGFVLDASSHTVTQYEVRRNGLLKDFLATNLLIHPTQVLSLTDEKMVVEDLVVPAEEAQQRVSGIATESTTT